ncbi:MAG: SIMPL domain-containing protein [Dehalococcoidia bacterium]|nr:SIMPL domain-containing protein [Dehalococcoidia bacterium]
MGKWKYVVLAVGTLALVGAVACAPITSNPQLTTPASVVVQSNQQTGLWVTGEGRVSAAPDVAIVSLGIEAQAKTVTEAQAQASSAMDRVMKALTTNGVADKDIQTQRFSIVQVTRWNKDLNRDEVIGYRVTNMVVAKIRNLNNAGAIIDAVVSAGGDMTRIQGIAFSIDDPSKYYKEARDKAVADAMAKAKQIAAGADIKLGKPTYISESQVYVPQPRIVGYDFMKTAAPEPSPPTPISPGETEVRLSVQIVYEIR